MSMIDDIFKDGLDGKGLPYDEAQWQKVEQSIPVKASFSWLKLGIAGTSAVTIGVATYFVLAAVQGTPSQENKNISIPEEVGLSKEKPSEEQDSKTDNNVSYTEYLGESSLENEINQTLLNKKNLDDIQSINQNTESNQFGLVTDNQVSADKNTSNILKPTLSAKNLSVNQQLISCANTHNDIINQFKKLTVTRGFSLGLMHETCKIDASKKIRKIKPPLRSDWRYFVSPFAEYAVHTELKDFSNTVVDELGNMENSEPVSTFNYGLQLRAQRGKWSIGSGLMLTSTNEQTNFTSSESSYTYKKGLRVVDTAYTTTTRGTRVILVEQVIVDSTQVITKSIECEDCQNEINYLTIPLFVRYNFGKSRLRYFGELGGTLAFIQKNQGQFAVVEKASNTVAIRSLESVDLNSMIVSLTLNAGAQYHINNRISAWTSLGIRNSRTSTFSNLNHLTKVTALKVGIEYRLK